MILMDLQLFAEGRDFFAEGFDDPDSDLNLENLDDEVEETTEETEPIPEEETEVEETTEEAVTENPQTLKVKYNKEERELTLEEATILAQKGLNYDKVVEKLSEFEQNRGLGYLEKLANRSGKSVEELVDFWEQQEQQEELNQLIQNNIPEEYAKEILENRNFRKSLEEKQRHEQIKEKQDQEYREFFEKFPDVKPDEIPQEVWQENEKGTPLKVAMMEYNYKKLETENAQLKNNQKNLLKGNPGGIAAKQHTETNDPFLDGFDSW